MITNDRALQLYYAISEHFRNKDYDAIKYEYRITGVHSRVDYGQNSKIIWRVLNLYKTEERLKIFFVMNMLKNRKSLFDIVNRHLSTSEKDFSDFYDTIHNDQESFEKDIRFIINKCGSVNNSLKYIGGESPKLLDFIKQKDVQYITIIILDSLIGVINRIDKLSPKDTLWKKEKFKIEKLSSFIEIGDNSEYIKIINKINQNTNGLKYEQTTKAV